eukprot:m.211917 g.211917  ORF g.211917 m.211917 type:complete len:285 (-) comp18582_c0_seq1:220-1074(-)
MGQDASLPAEGAGQHEHHNSAMATQPAGEGDRRSPRHDRRHVDGDVPAAPHAGQFQPDSGDEDVSHDHDSDTGSQGGAEHESSSKRHARDERVVALRRYHKTAYKLINEALDLDARGMVQTALEKYTLGLASLDGGLGITIPPDVSGREWDKARTLREKMKANRGMVLDRVQDLNEKAALLTPRFLTQASQPRAAEKARPSSAAAHAKPAHAKPAAHTTRPHRQHDHNLPPAKPVPAQANPQAKAKACFGDVVVVVRIEIALTTSNCSRHTHTHTPWQKQAQSN